MKTGMQQKLPAQLEKQLESFVKQVNNMDETPLYFDILHLALFIKEEKGKS